MKLIFIAAVLFISLSLVSALDADFGIKSSYEQGETIIGKFSYNFVDSPQESDIKLYRNHVRVPFEPYLFKIENEYYFYGQAPFSENNYTIKIEDVSYKVGKDTSEEPLESNFTTLNTTTQFSVEPAVIYTKQNISITVQNLAPNTITISASLDDQSKSESILSGEEETFKFNPENLKIKSVQTLTVSSDSTSYEIPVYIYENLSVSNNDDNNNSDEEITNKSLIFLIPSNNITLATSDSITKSLSLKNDGNVNLSDISISLSSNLEDYVSLSDTFLDELNSGEIQILELNIVSDSGEKTIEGTIKAETDDLSLETPLILIFIPGYEPPVIDPIEDPTETQSCFDLQGNDGFCTEDETCDGTPVTSFEGSGCCIGTCVEKPASSTGKIIGWVLLIALLIFLAWFFLKKYKGASRPNTNLIKIGSKN